MDPTTIYVLIAITCALLAGAAVAHKYLTHLFFQIYLAASACFLFSTLLQVFTSLSLLYTLFVFLTLFSVCVFLLIKNF